MSNIVHDKYHRQNHHSFITSGVTDMGLDPIASKELPFSGEFVMDNGDNETWVLSSDRIATEWVSGYGDADVLKVNVDVSGADGKTMYFPSSVFGVITVGDGQTDAPVLSVVGKSVFTDDVIYNGDIKLDGDLTVPNINVTGISAENVLISGGEGVVLDVPNGSSRFGNVTGHDFIATGNIGVSGGLTVADEVSVGGNLRVHDTLYFTNGSAPNGQLIMDGGVARFGSLTVDGTIIAASGVFNKTIERDFFNDESGFVLHSTSLSEEQKELIPGKDVGTNPYVPGIGNFTLSAMGLSSDSWASFSGNVRVAGDKFYDDANETIITNQVYFNTVSGTTLIADNIYASGGATNVQSITADSMLFDGATGVDLSAQTVLFDGATGVDLSAQTVLFDGATGVDLSAYSMSASSLDVTTMTAASSYAGEFDFFGTINYEPNRDKPGRKHSIIHADEAGRLSITPETIEVGGNGNGGTREYTPLITYTKELNPRQIQNKEVITSDYLNVYWNPRPQMLVGYPGGDGWTLIEVCDFDNHKMPMNVNPIWTSNTVPDDNENNEKVTWWNWYKQASSKIYFCKHVNNVRQVAECYVSPQVYDNNVELCFTYLVSFDANATLSNTITFQLANAEGEGQGKYLDLNDMYGPNGQKITLSDFRRNKLGISRTLCRVHLMCKKYVVVEILGTARNWSSDEELFK